MDAAPLGWMLGGAGAGAAIGGTLAALWAAARARAALAPQLAESRAAERAGAATIAELRGQVAVAAERAGRSELEVRRLEADKAAGAARLSEMERSLDEQYRLLDEAKGQLKTTFSAVAAEALQRSNEGFLQLANETFSAVRRESATELAAREHAIAEMVAPVKQSLEKFDEHVHALEKSRGEAYVRLNEQVRALSEGQRALQSGTDSLVTALRAPVVRGQWGEVQLRRVLEMAGMIEHCDFVEQATVTTADGRIRPDVVVKLPGGKSVVVDAKAPLLAFLAAREAKTDAERTELLRQHAQQVRAHVIKLAAKNYWEQFAASPEMVLMFLPGDAFYAAALEQMPELFEEAIAQRVLIATPMTLMGVLRAIHVGWKQERLAESAEEISRCGRDLHERLATFGEHIGKVGVALGRTVEAFNGAVGSYENRVLPGARKLEELGAGGKKTLEDTEPVDARPRPLMATTTPAVAPTGRGSIRQLPLRGPQAVRAEADEASPPLADASA
jgi:DNA recombination protein RmuC